MADEMYIFEDSDQDLTDFSMFEDAEDDKETQPLKQEEEEEENKEIIEETSEEEEEKVETPSTESEKNITDDDSENENVLSSIVNVIREEGFFDLKEGEELKVESPEDFVEVLTKIRDSAIESSQVGWTDAQKEYFEAIKSGIPHEMIVQHQQREQAYSSITDDAIMEESDEGQELRRSIIKAGFLAKGFSDDKAEKLTERSFKENADVEDAQDTLKELKDIEKANFEKQQQEGQKQEQERIKAAKKYKEDFNKYVSEVKEVIPETSIPLSMKKELIAGLTKPVSYDENDRPLDIVSDYLYNGGYEARFKLAYLIKHTEGLTKMDKLSAKQAEKSVTKRLGKYLSKPSTSGASFSKDESLDLGLSIDKDLEGFDDII